ncbi:MAG: glycoside hydrolase family 32 protein [Verrucomicrobiota bacterium]
MKPVNFSNHLARLLLCYVGATVISTAAEDMILTDFEGGNFGDWKVEGEAFGDGPAKGGVNGQMEVSGFFGTGFANSYHGGDDAIGTLTSPEFKVARKYLNFLIGGGKHTGEACMNLLLDGKVIRTATGPNDKPGGSERLAWASWDLSELMGKAVTLEIVDGRKGGWGHVTVDHIVQSDVAEVADEVLEFTVDKRYLVWPVKANSGDKVRVFMTLDGSEEPFCFSDIALTDQPDFWTFTDLEHFQGRKFTVKAKVPRALAAAWKQVQPSDTYPGEQELYQEPLRPQYHFTSRRGWLNDPNGLVYQNGVWHLFYQHNPYSHAWDNMHWGHATSPDLLRWTEHAVALFPDAEGTMYSGSGFVVPAGKSGLPVKGETALVLAYTAEGTRSYLRGRKTEQGLAVSPDGGKTFAKFPGNPVLPHIAGENRDPKVLWHEATRRWVMALYLDGPDYGIFTSPDLVEWKRTDTYQIPGDTECPDLFPLAVNGDTDNVRWVVWGANGMYRVGSFDGEKFSGEGGVRRHYFGAAYAGQSYDNVPDGRRVHIGWMRDGGAGLAGAPFNLQMTLPMDFTLRGEGDGIRLHAEPSAETASLRVKTREWKDWVMQPGDANPLEDFKDGLFEIEAVMDAGTTAKEAGFRIFDDHAATWRPDGQTFSGTEGAQPPLDGKIHLRIFVDTVSMEVFVNGTYQARYIRQAEGKLPIRVVADGGEVKFDSLKVHTLKSVWK